MHALVGENGSGKSTLLGIASGFVDPDRGTVRIGGKTLDARLAGPVAQARSGDGLPGRFVRPRRARQEQPLLRRGIGAPALSATQEVGASRARRLRPRLGAVPRCAGCHADDGGAPAVRGGQGTRQRAQGAAARRAHDRARPRRGRRRSTAPSWRASGAASVSSTSAIGCQKCSRSQTGSPCFATANTKEPSTPRRRPNRSWSNASSDARSRRCFPPRVPASSEAEEVLVVDALQGQSFGPVSFTLHSGEVVGIAGAEGNGQPQLFDSLAGRTPPRAGRVVCRGKELTLISAHEAVGAGIMLLPGDRKREALMGVLGREGEHHRPVAATLQPARRAPPAGRASRCASSSSSSSRSAPRGSTSRSSSCPVATSRRSPSHVRSSGNRR